MAPTAELRIDARPDEVTRLYAWLDGAIAALPDPVRNDMHVALEEVVMNVAFHAYAPEQEGEVAIALTLAPEEAVVVVEDAGQEFNPISAPPGKPEGRREEPGGLGLVLLRHHCRALEYERNAGRNRLTLRFAIGQK